MLELRDDTSRGGRVPRGVQHLQPTPVPARVVSLNGDGRDPEWRNIVICPKKGSEVNIT